MNKRHTSEWRRLGEDLLQTRTPDDLSRLLGITTARLADTAEAPAYATFYVDKRNGGKRLIEDPAPPLKALQRRLNDLLQGLYWLERSEAAYGFVVNPLDDPHPRHIVTHAERHLGCRRLINVDLEGFFHQIDNDRVRKTLLAPPLQLEAEAVELLVALTTWKGRLPMGAPTSPVLSNLAFRDEDLYLTRFARDRGWLYTRYADDLTFSSRNQDMEPHHLHEIVQHLEDGLKYTVHPEKRRYSDDGDIKSVTRLVLEGNQVTLPEEYFHQLDETLNDLSSARRVHHRMGGRHTLWLEDYNARIEGLLSYARYVLDERDPVYMDLKRRYDDANQASPDDFGAYTWFDFPYFE
ncbi:MAG: RNA-directed DNA polymerase [Saprospiraceae bacterium]|nr:RNA-directed DNA polymerase [Saprospiraceae bacterium]